MSKVKIWIEAGCIGCETCANIAPEVFSIKKSISFVKQNINLSKNKQLILNAIKSCPVKVIKMSK